MKSAMNIISGDKDKRVVFDMALEAIADDVANKVGEMERFMDVSENFMQSVDLQNGIFEEEGLRMLEKWEQEGVSSILGDTYGAQAGASSGKSVASAFDKNGLLGTLVICAASTNKNVHMFSPLQLDVDTAIEIFVSRGYVDIPTHDLNKMKKLALEADTPNDRQASIPVISGVAYGSSVVGLIHFSKILIWPGGGKCTLQKVWQTKTYSIHHYGCGVLTVVVLLYRLCVWCE